MRVKIKGLKKLEATNLDVKRCYMPGFVVTSKCPECGVEDSCDLGSSQYLSYPTANGWNQIYFTHDILDKTGAYKDCHEWREKVWMSVGLSTRKP